MTELQFDHLFYVRLYNDVWLAGIRTRSAAYRHWITIGRFQQRIVSTSQVTMYHIRECQFNAKQYELTLTKKPSWTSPQEAFCHWILHRPMAMTIPYPFAEQNIVTRERMRLGVVVTTHGPNSAYVRQCIASYYRCIPSTCELHLILYINETTDVEQSMYKQWFPKIEMVFISDQTKNGGLTGTWNQGIEWCVKKKCNYVLLSNDDLMITSSIRYMLDAAHKCQSTTETLCYFGPVTNNPGPRTQNKIQYATQPLEQSMIATRSTPLNGFCMLFPVHVLEANRFNDREYFDVSKPFGGNEVEWATRLYAKYENAFAVVVPQTFVYHLKLASWRTSSSTNSISTSSEQECSYTINTGHYENRIVFDNTFFDHPVFYFTDNESTIFQAIQKGCIPMHTDVYHVDCLVSNPSAYQIQRFLKTSPHLILPANYTTSVYLDGNLIPDRELFNRILEDMQNTPDIHMICWAHPNRTSIREEAKVVKKISLETSEKVDSMLHQLDMYGYTKEHDNVLTETNVLIRRHNRLKTFAVAWAKAVNVCRRDQLSFDFLVRHFKVAHKQHAYEDKPVTKMKHSGNIRTRKI